MGARVNPDDYNFINEFNKLAKFFPKQNFYIIQHPMYPHKIEFLLNQNVRVVQYNYDKFNLESYYKNLSTFDLIIGGGTSLLLDAAILETPVIFIGFEYQQYSYWTSALRYMDHVYHFNKFIRTTNIFICKSHSELVTIIRRGEFNLYRNNAKSISYFTGNTNLDLNAKLTELIC
jgi:predicted glycosyltransferase